MPSSHTSAWLYSSQCPPLIPQPGSLLLSVSSPHTSVWLSTPLSVLPSYLCLAPLNALPLPGSPLLSVSSPHTSAWLSTPLRVLPSYLCLALHSTVVLIIGNNHCFNDMYTGKSPSQLSACARHASMFVL